eukprot:COSAG02_NODE_1477_length_12419_cov_15.891396_6_plen_139_part_00
MRAGRCRCRCAFMLTLPALLVTAANGRFKHVVHRVPNPPAGLGAPGNSDRISLMAYVAPDWDAPLFPPLPGCLEEGEAPKYEPTWVAEATLWERGKGTGLFDEKKQDRMRIAQGLYTEDGRQSGEIGDPTDFNAVGKL